MSNLINITSHKLSHEQIQDAMAELHASNIINLPPILQEMWSNIPPENEVIYYHIFPVLNWLDSIASANDYVLIQGDYGATFLAVMHCFKKHYNPCYITTKRKTHEDKQDDGSVKITRLFKHVQFRMYEKL